MTRVRKESISVRMPSSLIDELDQMVQEEKFNDRSDAIVKLTRKGLDVEALIQMNKNPETKAMFEENLKQLMSKENVEQTLETFDDETLKAVLSYGTILHERRFKQELLKVR